jgi:ABC-2 type transport system permease protein
LLVPPAYDEELTAGTSVDLPFFARPDGLGPQLQAVVGSVVAQETAPMVAAIVADGQGAGPIDEAEARARQTAESMPKVIVETSTIGESLFPATLGRFDLGAASQLTLFMFVTALTGAAVLIETRRLGISTRMISTPTSVGTVVAGEGLGRYLVVLFQGLYIMVATLLIFRVDWGDPVGAIAVVLAFAAVGAGTAMLFGTLFSNAQQAIGVGIVFALGLAALGGSMVPAELFSDTLQRVARLTPHYWANSAFAELVRNGGTLADILPQLGVLLAYAAVLLVLATWRMRVVITRP